MLRKETGNAKCQLYSLISKLFYDKPSSVFEQRNILVSLFSNKTNTNTDLFISEENHYGCFFIRFQT